MSAGVEPTPYPDVNAILSEILNGAREILGARWVGMYLYGSLAGGDFDPEHSDIDFVVVTNQEVRGDALARLERMHTQIAAGASRWATQLEGSYISAEALRRFDATNNRHPHIDRGSGETLVVRSHDCDWVIQRYVLRARGVTLAGPPIAALIDPISTDELHAVVRRLVEEWWAPMLDKPAHLEQVGYRTYAIGTMCRILYTLRYGTIVSKPAAERWALDALDPRWSGLIERAMAWQVREDDLGETIEFIRYAVAQSRGRRRKGEANDA